MDSRLGIWAINSGVSHNYCNDLTEFKKDSITKANMIIKLGDKNEVHTRKKGMVQLNGVCIEAFFVPEFRIFLLSVSQLDSLGLTALFKNGTCAIMHHLGNNPLSATLDRGLYILPRHASAYYTPVQQTEKKFGSRSNTCMMLGYVHDTTKIWRNWDFKSGRSGGRAVECSRLIFQEEENAHGKGAEEEKDTVFPEQTERSYEIVEDHPGPQGKWKRRKKTISCPHSQFHPPFQQTLLGEDDTKENPIYKTEWNNSCQEKIVGNKPIGRGRKEMEKPKPMEAEPRKLRPPGKAGSQPTMKEEPEKLSPPVKAGVVSILALFMF